MKYKVCPDCGAMYDEEYEACDLHGAVLVPLRPATDQEVMDFEELA